MTDANKPNNCIMCGENLTEEETILLDGLPVCSDDCKEDLADNGTGEPARVGGMF